MPDTRLGYLPFSQECAGRLLNLLAILLCSFAAGEFWLLGW